MAIPLAVLLCILAASGAAEAISRPTFDPNCPVTWKSIFAGHTMCIVGDVGKDVPFDPQAVVNYHNLKRGSVNPPATDMRKVYWDTEAAVVAAKWARQCGKYGRHDVNEARMLPSYKFLVVGQNGARSSKQDWREVIDMWYNEVNHFVYGVGNTLSNGTVGHYAQMVSKEVYRIGCGMAECPGEYKYSYACNYITRAGKSETNPYTSGTRCASCPVDKCTDGLCDCGTSVCKYQSFPNKACGCDCQPHMSGPLCDQLTCQSERYCSQFTKESCKAMLGGTTNVIRYLCPKMCGLC